MVVHEVISVVLKTDMLIDVNLRKSCPFLYKSDILDKNVSLLNLKA